MTILNSVADVGIIVFDLDLRCVSAGGLGLVPVESLEQPVGGRAVDVLFAPDVASVLAVHFRLAFSGEASDADVSDSRRICALRFTPVRAADGTVVAGMAFAQDVTDIRAAERELRESEELFRATFEHAPIGTALVSLDGRYEQVNAAMCDITGYTDTELRGLAVADITHPDDLAADAAAMARLRSGELTSYTLEKRYRTAHGSVVWVVKSRSLVRRADGSALHFSDQIQDITERKDQEQVLGDERRRLREAQVIGRVGSWELDVASDTVTWSDTLFDLYGLDREDVSFREVAEHCVHPEDSAKLDAAVQATMTSSAPLNVRYRIVRPSDGAVRWFDARGYGMREGEQLVRVVGAVVDVTELVEQIHAEAESKAVNAFQAAVMGASPDIILVYDVSTRSVVWSNRSLTESLGYDPEELDEHGEGVIDALVPEDDQAQFESVLSTACEAADDAVVQLNHRLRQADGSHRWFSRRTTPLSRDENGRVTQLVCAWRDITDAMLTEKRLEHFALHDGLTGLPNRALLVDRIDAALARSKRDRREVAVLFCDLDGFKRVNDTAGHAAGDAVLLEAAARLQGAVRDGDTVARVGGDEFVVIVEPWNRDQADEQHRPSTTAGDDRALALQVAERITNAVRQPMTINGTEHIVTASIGVTYGRLSPSGHSREVTADEILQDADAAMYQAKGRGKDRFEVFEQSMRADTAERGRVERVLREALRRPSVHLRKSAPLPRQSAPLLAAAYQPIFDSATRRLVGFEALARLTDRDGTDIPPDVFIGVAEETGTIRAVGTHMLELACGQLAAWRADTPGLSGLTMAVNVSALQAQDASLGQDTHTALAAHQLVPTDLILELTETALLEAARSTITSLRLLRDEGIGIAIDDFGTGYASLRYLATLPVSAVKIDKSFTAGLPTDPTCRKIVKAVAGLAADMHLTCIVEGVETPQQYTALPTGVQIQGWLTGRPQPPQQLDLLALVAFGAPDLPAPSPSR